MQWNWRPAWPRGGSGILWLVLDDGPPHRYLVAACRQAGEAVRGLYWGQSNDGQRPLGLQIKVGVRRAERDHPMVIRVISPRLLVQLARAPEDVVVCCEFGLAGLFAGLSKAFRRRKVVVLVEGDYQYTGRTGNAALKVALRRLVARLSNVCVANNEPAKDYLVSTLKVPDEKIVVGWWLAGLPRNMEARLPRHARIVPDGVPLFVYAGRLIPAKGVDLLIEALSIYRQEFGPCMLWILGDGPEEDSLRELAHQLQVDDVVAFLGPVDHQEFKGALEACNVLVFPTLRDFIGRVTVEALTVGVPVVLTPMTGAAGTIVQDGVNGVVVDPRNRHALAEALRRAADPETLEALRAGVRRMNASLTPDAGAEVILRAVALARGGHRAAQAREQTL